MPGPGRRFQKGQGGRKPGVPNRVTQEVREVAQNIIGNPDYLARLKVRIDRGTAPHMETLLWHYAYGKPKDVVQHEALGGESSPVAVIFGGRHKPDAPAD